VGKGLLFNKPHIHWNYVKDMQKKGILKRDAKEMQKQKTSQRFNIVTLLSCLINNF